jgi:hypothetical protein
MKDEASQGSSGGDVRFFIGILLFSSFMKVLVCPFGGSSLLEIFCLFDFCMWAGLLLERMLSRSRSLFCIITIDLYTAVSNTTVRQSLIFNIFKIQHPLGLREKGNVKMTALIWGDWRGRNRADREKIEMNGSARGN